MLVMSEDKTSFFGSGWEGVCEDESMKPSKCKVIVVAALQLISITCPDCQWS